MIITILVYVCVIALLLLAVWLTLSAYFKNVDKRIAEQGKERETALDTIVQEHERPHVIQLPSGAKLLWMISGCHGLSMVTRLMRNGEGPTMYTMSHWISKEEADGSLKRVFAATGPFPRELTIFERQFDDDYIFIGDTPVIMLPPGQKLVWMRTGCDTEFLTRARTPQDGLDERYFIYSWDEGNGVVLTTVIQET